VADADLEDLSSDSSERERWLIELAPQEEVQDLWVGDDHVVDVIPRGDGSGFSVWCRCDNDSWFNDGLPVLWPLVLRAHCGLTPEESEQVETFGILGGPAATLFLIRDYVERRYTADRDIDG
jgi:hypothetical protein